MWMEASALDVDDEIRWVTLEFNIADISVQAGSLIYMWWT